ncbi:MAG: SpoIID/LytB domain-containing protein [Clostridia bacterium]|nr:SpoIID/LytB domain-containing protein [Clostridia bacterium]MBO5670753.1 SpoIID/LytB domain-containing protein [Clostridia bacterium]
MKSVICMGLVPLLSSVLLIPALYRSGEIPSLEPLLGQIAVSAPEKQGIPSEAVGLPADESDDAYGEGVGEMGDTEENVDTEEVVDTEAPPSVETTPQVPPSASGYDASQTITLARADGSYTLSLRDYLIGIVMAEMPSYFHPEALRAQAVAARSYVLYRIRGGFGLTDLGSTCTAYMDRTEAEAFFGDALHQVEEIVAAAVDDTDGQVLLWENKVICAVFHAMSYGKTENAVDVWGGDYPYLRAADTPEALSISGICTEASFDEGALCAALSVSAALPFAFTKTDGGRLAEVICADGTRIHGEDFRSRLRMRSTDIEILRQSETDVTFRVYGYGHGIGLSQYGADLFADSGMNYTEILAHYYAGSVLAVLS